MSERLLTVKLSAVRNLNFEDNRKTLLLAMNQMKEALTEMGYGRQEANCRVAEECRMMIPSKEEVDQSDIIIGIDRVTGVKTFFYGKSLLTLVENGYEDKERTCKVRHVWLDVETDEPDQLAAWVLYVKGSCDCL